MTGLGHILGNIHTPSTPQSNQPMNQQVQHTNPAHGGGPGAPTKPPRDTSHTSSSNLEKTYYQNRYAEEFKASGVRQRAFARLQRVCGENFAQYDDSTPLAVMLARHVPDKWLTPSDCKESDSFVSYVPEDQKLNAFRTTTEFKQGQDHNGIPAAINQGNPRAVHCSMFTHTAGNPLATTHWPEQKEALQQLEELKLLDASRAFEAVKDPLLKAMDPTHPVVLSANGKIILGEMDTLQKAMVELGEIEDVVVKLDELEKALESPGDPSTAWTKFDKLVVALKDSKGDVYQTVLAQLEPLVNDPDLSSNRDDGQYDPSNAFKKLNKATPLFSALKDGPAAQEKAKALDAVSEKLGRLENALNEKDASAADHVFVNAAKEKFDALKQGLSSSMLGGQKEALPTFARLKTKIWSFGDPIVTEARNGGNARILTSRIQRTTFNPTEHGYVHVYRPAHPVAIAQAEAASLVLKVLADGEDIAYSIGELSNSMKINNPDKPETMSATIEYTDEAVAKAIDMAKDAFNPKPEWGKNARNTYRMLKNGVSCSTATARAFQAGAIAVLEQKWIESHLDEPSQNLDREMFARQVEGIAAINPKHVSPRTYEHLMLTAEDESGNPYFEYVGKMKTEATDVRFTETYPLSEPEYLPDLSPHDERSTEFQERKKRAAPSEPVEEGQPDQKKGKVS